MIPSKYTFRISFSLLLAVSVATVFSLSALAALENSKKLDRDQAADSAALQSPTGTLVVARSRVNINGVAAKEGATVLNGSVVYTGTGSQAGVEIPALGRADYGENTESVLTMSEKRIDSSLNKCGSITLTLLPGITGTIKIIHVSDVGVFSERRELDVRVMRGQAIVKRLQNQESTVNPGEHKEFDDAIEVTAVGDAVFKVYCKEDHPIVLAFLPSLAALLIPFGDEDTTPAAPVLSPLVP